MTGREIRNSNIEIRNNEQMSKVQMTETKEIMFQGKPQCFEHSEIRILNLFRISSFECHVWQELFCRKQLEFHNLDTLYQ